MRWGFAILALLGAFQDDLQQVDNVYFRIPKGWKRVDRGSIRSLVPANLAAGRTAGIFLCQGEEPAVAFPAWFEKSWETVCKEQNVEQVLREREVERITAFGAASGLAKTAALKLKGGAEILIVLIGFEVTPRAESMLFVTNDAQGLDGYLKAFAAFRESLSFATKSSEPFHSKVVWREDLWSPSFTRKEVPPRRGKAGLSGMYRAFLMERRRFALQERIEPKYFHWVFFPDGTCYSGLPEEGLLGCDLDYWRKKNPEWCGTYELRGDEGTITIMPGDKPFTQTLRRAPEGLLIGGKGPYKPLDPCEGLLLEGRFKADHWEPEPDIKGWMSFRNDGTFVDEGLLCVANAAWWRPRKVHPDQNAEAVPGKGKYRIAENTLELHYEDGRKRRVNFSLPDNVSREKPVEGIMVNTTLFKREK